MSRLMRFIAVAYSNLLRAIRRIDGLALAYRFPVRGSRLRVGHGGEFTFERITIGDDVFIGPHARFSATNSEIVIGHKVMFGPGVTIMAGDHNTSAVGKYMADVHQKAVGNDLPVIIETDCWIGANVIILKGVTIGRGSVVGAGAIVSRSVPPYSIVIGEAARPVRQRFPAEVLQQHIMLLGGQSDA